MAYKVSPYQMRLLVLVREGGYGLSVRIYGYGLEERPVREMAAVYYLPVLIQEHGDVVGGTAYPVGVREESSGCVRPRHVGAVWGFSERV